MPSAKSLRGTFLTVGFVVLIALSGCAGLTDTGSTPSAADTPAPTPSVTQTQTQTPTPSPSPTATPTVASVDQLPPGVNETGVRNATQLLRAHQADAIATPGVVTHTTNSSGLSVVAKVRVAADRNLTRVRYVSQSRRTAEGGTRNATTVIAANQTSVRQYTLTDGNVTLENRRNRTDLYDRALRGLSTGMNPLRGTLQRGNFSIASASELNGTAVVTLRADQFAGGQSYSEQNVVAYNATIRVTTDGLVRSVTEQIVAQRNGNKAQYNFAYEFEPQPVALPAVPQVPADISVQSGSTSDG